MATKKTKKNKQIKPAEPTPQAGSVCLILSKEELTVLVNLMNICSKTFEALALKSAQDNDNESFNTFVNRQKLANIYINRFVSSLNMGEPNSREYH